MIGTLRRYEPWGAGDGVARVAVASPSAMMAGQSSEAVLTGPGRVMTQRRHQSGKAEA